MFSIPDLDLTPIHDSYAKLPKVNSTEWLPRMQIAIEAKSMSECILLCHWNESQCDALAFVIDRSLCYIGDLRTQFRIFDSDPEIMTTVYTKHGIINKDTDRSIYWGSELYFDTRIADNLIKNPDSCEFFYHGTDMPGAFSNYWNMNWMGHPGMWGSVPVVAVVLDLHNQVEIWKILFRPSNNGNFADR